MKGISLIVVLMIMSLPLAECLPNFGCNEGATVERFPSPIQDSGFVARLTGIHVDYPDLIYISKDNRVIVLNTSDSKILYTIEAEEDIKEVLVADLENDEILELIVLSDLEIAVYTNYGNLKWDKQLDSLGVGAKVLKDVTEEVYSIIIVSENCISAFSYDGAFRWSREISRSNRVIVTDINQIGPEEIILIHEKSVEALSHNGSLLWETGFDSPISVAHEFPHLESILVSLEDGCFYFVDHLGRESRVGNAKMKTAVLTPLRGEVGTNPKGFFAISPSGQLRAYSNGGKIIGNLSRFRNVLSVIPCDLDEQKVIPCNPDSEIFNQWMPNKEEVVIISQKGEVEVLIYCHPTSNSQEREGYWKSLPLTTDKEGESSLKTGIENISFSLVFRTGSRNPLFFMTGDGTLHRYTLFSWATHFLNFFDYACSDFEIGDYDQAYMKLDDLDKEFIKYYGLEKDIKDKIEICMEKMKEEEKSARDLLSEGLEEKEKGNLEAALQKLFEAYLRFKETNFGYEDIIYEKDDTKISFSELEKKIIFLCLDFIKNAHEALEKNQYEDALRNLALVNKYWKTLEGYLAYFDDSEEYQEKYSEIESIRTLGKIQEKIDYCVERIDTEAIDLMARGDLEESKRKYDFIIKELKESKKEYDPVTGNIVDANWPSQALIDEFESKRFSIEEIIKAEKDEERRKCAFTVVIIVAVVIIIADFSWKWWKKRTTKGKLLAQLQKCKKLLDDEWVLPAGNMAGVVLERALKKMVDENEWKKDKNKGPLEDAMLGPLIKHLKDENKINKREHKALILWKEIRNSTAHDKPDILDGEEVKRMIEGIDRFIQTKFES